MKGIAVSKGVAIGKAYLLDRSKLCIIKQNLEENEVEKEIERFREAIEKTKFQMSDIKKRAKKIARNISKNTAIVIEEHYIPSFKPSKIFIDKIKRNVTSA